MISPNIGKDICMLYYEHHVGFKMFCNISNYEIYKLLK